MRVYYSLIIFIFLFSAAALLAQDDPFSQLTYPIPELGGCASRSQCDVYCENPENMRSCLEFARARNLLPKEEIEIAQRMLELSETAGPGGCRGQDECETYCDSIDHIEECVTFAERHNLIPPEELKEAKLVLEAKRRGINPPKCRRKSECDVYCSRPENMEECIVFGEAAGLIPLEELAEAKKVLEAVRKGAIPPACRGKRECDEYCAVPENFEQCISFAEAAGFVSPEEAAMARRTGGKGPGGCRGKEECDVFCEDPSHAEVCISFAEEFGFMSHEEAEQARKMLAAGLTGGPGGCKGEEECEAYCNDFSHLLECVEFAEKAGFMSAEDAARARQMAERGVNVMQGGPGGCRGEEECRAFCEDPANMQECLDFAVRIGEMTPEQAEQARQGREMMQQGGGPGGCQGEQECMAYCQDPAHLRECAEFAVEQGIMSPEQAQEMLQGFEGQVPPPSPGMPGLAPEFQSKCASPEECEVYCLQNPTDPLCRALECICTKEYQPVCGTDGRTYGNRCELGCMAALGVSLAHEGPCEGGLAPPSEMPPPEGIITPPSPEEIERIQQQEIERIRQQMMPPPSEMPPPPAEEPQSFFDRAKNFLGELMMPFR